MTAYVRRTYQGKSQRLNTAGYFEESNLYPPAEFELEDAALIAKTINHYATFAHYEVVRVKER